MLWPTTYVWRAARKITRQPDGKSLLVHNSISGWVTICRNTLCVLGHLFMLVLLLNNSNGFIIFLMFLWFVSNACSTTFVVIVARRFYMILRVQGLVKVLAAAIAVRIRRFCWHLQVQPDYGRPGNIIALNGPRMGRGHCNEELGVFRFTVVSRGAQRTLIVWVPLV